MKSYLTGNPPIAIALNDGLVIGRREGGGADFGYGRASDLVQLDDCNFHEARARWGWRRALRGPPRPAGARAGGGQGYGPVGGCRDTSALLHIAAAGSWRARPLLL